VASVCGRSSLPRTPRVRSCSFGDGCSAISNVPELKGRLPVMRTHYKYLLIPRMPPNKEYVTFNGEDFLMKGKKINPNLLIQTSYIPKETVSQLVRSAISHANPEKRGVHVIANGNKNVIDMEIAFSKVREHGPEDPAKLDEALDNKRGRAKSTAPRIDLAALFPNGEGKAHVVF
jgi:hypothetical protein